MLPSPPKFAYLKISQQTIGGSRSTGTQNLIRILFIVDIITRVSFGNQFGTRQGTEKKNYKT